MNGKDSLRLKTARDQYNTEALQKMNESSHPKGENIPTDQRVFRRKVVCTLLHASIPLNIIDLFRELLDEGDFRLTDCRHMSVLVPLIYQQEQELLKSELTGMCLSIISNGITRYGKATALLIRIVDDEF